MLLLTEIFFYLERDSSSLCAGLVHAPGVIRSRPVTLKRSFQVNLSKENKNYGQLADLQIDHSISMHDSHYQCYKTRVFLFINCNTSWTTDWSDSCEQNQIAWLTSLKYMQDKRSKVSKEMMQDLQNHFWISLQRIKLDWPQCWVLLHGPKNTFLICFQAANEHRRLLHITLRHSCVPRNFVYTCIYRPCITRQQSYALCKRLNLQSMYHTATEMCALQKSMKDA